MDARHHCFSWKSLVQTPALKGNFFILHLVTVRCRIEQSDFPAAGMGGPRTSYGAAHSKAALCFAFSAVEKCADFQRFMQPCCFCPIAASRADVEISKLGLFRSLQALLQWQNELDNSDTCACVRIYVLVYHRITACLGLEGTSVGHPVQPPAKAGSPRAGCTAPCPGRS